MKLYASLPDDLAEWAQRQPVFFTASAATHGRHVNVSPKGMTDTHWAVLDPNRCAYIDRTGSGCETIAHAYENGRLCLMFMSFGPAPRILRLFCRARVVEWDQPAFAGLVRAIARGKREAFDGARAVIVCEIWEVQTSCGYGVPRVKRGLYARDDDEAEYASQGGKGADDDKTARVDRILAAGYDKVPNKMDELAVFEARPTMDSWAATKAQTNTLLAYQRANNSASIDGLPGLRAARRSGGESPLWVGDARARLRRVVAAPDAVVFGAVLGFVVYMVAVAVLRGFFFVL